MKLTRRMSAASAAAIMALAIAAPGIAAAGDYC
jgi:hypothetical protein